MQDFVQLEDFGNLVQFGRVCKHANASTVPGAVMQICTLYTLAHKEHIGQRSYGPMPDCPRDNGMDKCKGSDLPNESRSLRLPLSDANPNMDLLPPSRFARLTFFQKRLTHCGTKTTGYKQDKARIGCVRLHEITHSSSVRRL